MEIETEKTEFKFFKWVIFSQTVVRTNHEIENIPIYILDKEYYKREFLN